MCAQQGMPGHIDDCGLLAERPYNSRPSIHYRWHDNIGGCDLHSNIQATIEQYATGLNLLCKQFKHFTYSSLRRHALVATIYAAPK